jgi:hypothetical protein
MVGSPFVGAWIAQIGFWVLMALGISYGAVSKRAAAIFMALWLAGISACLGLRGGWDRW